MKYRVLSAVEGDNSITIKITLLDNPMYEGCTFILDDIRFEDIEGRLRISYKAGADLVDDPQRDYTDFEEVGDQLFKAILEDVLHYENVQTSS